MTNPRAPFPTETIVLPDQFAPELINGQQDGLTKEDRAALERISAYVGGRQAVNKGPRFCGFCDATNTFGDVANYTFYAD